MKLQKIRKLCVDEKTVYIYEDPSTERQWIGNGKAAWTVEGITITEEMIPAIWDVPLEKYADYEVSKIDSFTADYDRMLGMLINTNEKDEDLEILPYQLQYGDKIYFMLKAADGCTIYLPVRQTEPALDLKHADMIRFKLCALDGHVAVAVYSGLICSGIIKPLTAEEAETITKRMRG